MDTHLTKVIRLFSKIILWLVDRLLAKENSFKGIKGIKQDKRSGFKKTDNKRKVSKEVKRDNLESKFETY